MRSEDDGSTVFLGAVVGTRGEKNEDTGDGLEKRQRAVTATESDRRLRSMTLMAAAGVGRTAAVLHLHTLFFFLRSPCFIFGAKRGGRGGPRNSFVLSFRFVSFLSDWIQSV